MSAIPVLSFSQLCLYLALWCLSSCRLVAGGFEGESDDG